MLEAEVIQESISDWASAPILIRKRDGSVRWCIDYTALNDVTVKDVLPLSLVHDCLDALLASQNKAGVPQKDCIYNQIWPARACQNGFRPLQCACNLYSGLEFSSCCHSWKTVLAFLDDVLVLGKTFPDHLVNLADALTSSESMD